MPGATTIILYALKALTKFQFVLGKLLDLRSNLPSVFSKTLIMLICRVTRIAFA